MTKPVSSDFVHFVDYDCTVEGLGRVLALVRDYGFNNVVLGPPLGPQGTPVTNHRVNGVYIRENALESKLRQSPRSTIRFSLEADGLYLVA